MRICSKRNLSLAIALCLGAAASQAANLVVVDTPADLNLPNAGVSNGFAQMIGARESWVMENEVDLGNEVLQAGRQFYLGVEVYGGHFNATVDKATGRYTFAIGGVMQGLDNDLGTVSPALSEEAAAEIALGSYASSALSNTEILDRDATKLWVYNFNGRAVYAYQVSALVRVGEDIQKPTAIVDASTGQILSFGNELRSVAARGTGPGGNGRTGQYEHGSTASGLAGPLLIDKVGTTCRLANPDTLVVNARNGNGTGSTAISYNCADANNRFVEATVNGGFGSSADILYHGTQTAAYYRRAFGTPALTCNNGLLVQYSHVMQRYDNAFYQNCQMRYGDGNSFYPLVSTDVVAHEISHGFTEQRSGLIYSNQSGGLNESFSDVVGSAFTFDLTGRPDFNIGSQISKNGRPLRFMVTPSQDGASIDTVNQFRTGMDVHFSSGAFNRAFANLAQKAGWNPTMAARIFVRANDLYYTPSTTFVQAGNALCRAATDLQFNTADVRASLQLIGLNPTGCNGGGTPPGGGNVLQNNVPVRLSLGLNQQVRYSFNAGATATRVTIRVTGPNGDTDLYVSRGALPTTTNATARSEGPTSNETVTLTNTGANTYNILLNGFAAATGVTLVATAQ